MQHDVYHTWWWFDRWDIVMSRSSFNIFLVFRLYGVVIDEIYLNFSIDPNQFEELIECHHYYVTNIVVYGVYGDDDDPYTNYKWTRELLCITQKYRTVNWARFSVCTFSVIVSSQHRTRCRRPTDKCRITASFVVHFFSISLVLRFFFSLPSLSKIWCSTYI